MSEPRNTTAWLNAGALGASIGASLCCVGPVALALAGLSGGAAFVSLAPLRPWLLGATLVLLATAFYGTYRRRPEECPESVACDTCRRRGQKVLLWIATGVAMIAAASPYLVDSIF